MTLPALWIRQNMLQSPGPVYNVNERPLTEAEMKVQRSLKKLSIPDWYLNNSSHPPKILMNDTPIDMRPPSWKEQNVKNTAGCSTPLMQIRNCTVNRNGVLETEIGPATAQNQFYGTFKISRSSIGNRSPLSKRRSSPQKEAQPRSKESSKSRLFNVSRTFPRVSPSRKIQNINIVFDQPSRSSHSHTITDLDASDPEIVNMSDDSLEGRDHIEPSLRSPPTLSQSLIITDLDRTEPEIGMIGDSLTTQLSETIDRRLASPPPSSGTYRITDLDRSEPEIGMIDDSLATQLSGTMDRRLVSPPASSGTYRITDLDRSEPEIGMIDDSLATQLSETIDRRLASRPTSSGTYRITDLDDPSSQPPETEDSSIADRLAESADRTLDDAVVGSNSLEKRVQRAPNRELTYIKPWKPAPRPEVRSCVTPEGKFMSAASFKLRASSTPQGSPVSIFAASGLELTPRAGGHLPTSGLPVAPPKKSPSPAPRLTSPETPEAEEVCEVCKANPSRSPNGHSTSGFRPRSLLPAIRERPSSSPTSVASLTSKKKSSELEAMIKRRTARQGKSLVQEIIEELNEKCRSSAQSTYVSPGSKNFVKKLVRALEKGKTSTPRSEEEDPSCRRFDALHEDEEDAEDEEDYAEEDNSEDDAKSAAASTSISYKDTDSSAGSDSDLRSPTMKIEYNYDCNMNVRKTGSAPAASTTSTMVTSTPDYEKENDSVYWIPVAKSKLPRTSSLLSMMSRLSTTNPQPTPCVSPIKQNGERQSGWGATYKPSEQLRTLRRIDETTILDSGYSDRSRVHSSESSDETWFDDESTWTASETGSLSSVSFSLGSRLRHERQAGIQVRGRPFVI